jgi:hypothetical protein
MAAPAPQACPSVGPGLNYATRIQGCIANITNPRVALLARFATPQDALNAVLAALIPAARVPIEPVVRNFISAFVAAMQAVGNDSDVMVARAGDLYHDIEDEISRPIGPVVAERISMEGYVGTTDGGDVAAPALATFKTNIRNIIPKFDTFGRTRAIAICPKGDLTPLNQIMRGPLGIRAIMLDACFGNPFSKNLTTGLNYIDATVSQIDGASKISEASLRGFIAAYNEHYKPFRVPHFYYNSNHIVTTELNIEDYRENRVTVTMPPATTATIMCEGGFSVNAISRVTGLTPPRGVGGVSSPIEIEAAGGEYAYNHIVFIKTLTDWGQLVYCFLMNMIGINTAFITNDEYCLCLAAILRLPCVIRTPSTSSPIVELYSFSPIDLIPAERAAIEANLRIGVPDGAALLAMIPAAAGPDNILRTCLINELAALRMDVEGLIASFPPILDGRAIAPARIANNRFLSTTSPTNYIRGFIIEKLEKIKISFKSLGFNLTSAYAKLKSSGDIESIIGKFSNFLASIPGGLNTVNNIKLCLRLYSYTDIIGTTIGVERISGKQRIINAISAYLDGRYSIDIGELPAYSITSHTLINNVLDGVIRVLNPEEAAVGGAGAGAERPIVGKSGRGEATFGAISTRSSKQRGGGEEQTSIDNEPMYYLHPFTIADNTNIDAVIKRSNEYTGKKESYKHSLNIRAVKKHIETLSTVTSIAEFATFIQQFLYLTQEDAYESNYSYETFSIDIEYLIEGYKLGIINDAVLTEQLEWYVYAHPESSNLLQNTIPFESFVSIHKKLAEIGVSSYILTQTKNTANVTSSKLQNRPIHSNYYKSSAKSAIQSVAVAAGGARRSRRHRSSPRRQTRNKRRDHAHASRRRRTIRHRK